MNAKSRASRREAAPTDKFRDSYYAQVRETPQPHLVVKAEGPDRPFLVVHALTSLIANSKDKLLSISTVAFHTFNLAGERRYELSIRATAPDEDMLKSANDAVWAGRLFASGDRLEDFQPDDSLRQVAEYPERGWPVTFWLDGVDRPGLVRLVALEVARGRGTIDELRGEVSASRACGQAACFSLTGSCLCDSEDTARLLVERLRALGSAGRMFTLQADALPARIRHAA